MISVCTVNGYVSVDVSTKDYMGNNGMTHHLRRV